jgi:hypothetical protein
MSLKTSVKRLERELRPPEEVILYFPAGLEDEGEPEGMVKVINWSRPGWSEFITQEECDRRIKEDIKNGVQICGPGWERWYENET